MAAFQAHENFPLPVVEELRRLVLIRVDRVFNSPSALRGDDPLPVLLGDRDHRCQEQTALFTIQEFPVLHGHILCGMRRDCRKMPIQGAFGPFTPECLHSTPLL
jgi:hypothetical protein